ncbi:16372_t:CDS:1, partial [Racocetra fulgida]
DSKYLFGEIAKKLFTAEDVILTVKGELNVIAKTPVGDIELKNISFNFDKNFKCCHIQSGIIVNSMEIIEATRDTIGIRGVATMTNPSNVEIDLNSNVEFDLISDQNIEIAKMTIENFKLKRGNEDINVKIKYLPDNDRGYKLIENYLNRRSSLLLVKSTNETTSTYLLQKFFESLEFKTLLPGIKAQLIDEIEVSLRTKDSFMLHNPLKTKLYLFGFTSKVINMFNKQIATGITEPSVDGIVIESGQSRKIRIENTNMDVGNAIRNIKDCVNGVKENVECVLMFGI